MPADWCATMLEALSLTKRYDRAVALDALNLSVKPGEIFCLLGANGAGKTTTINLFLNFLQPSAGTARINGIDVTQQPLEIATAVYPVPSRVAMIQATRVASDEANAEGSTLLAAYYEDHPELATGDADQAMLDFNLVRVAVNDDIERRVQPVLDRYADRLAAQQRLVAWARFLSPAILMQDALNDVAGTGTARHRLFMDQVEAYHARWRQYFVSLIFQKVRLTDFSGVPQFTFGEELSATVARRSLATLLGLMVPTAALALLGVWRLRRYPVVG